MTRPDRNLATNFSVGKFVAYLWTRRNAVAFVNFTNEERTGKKCTLQKHRIGVRLFEWSFQFILQNIQDFLFGELEASEFLQDPHTEHLRSFFHAMSIPTAELLKCSTNSWRYGDSSSMLLVGVAHHRVFVGMFFILFFLLASHSSSAQSLA